MPRPTLMDTLETMTSHRTFVAEQAPPDGESLFVCDGFTDPGFKDRFEVTPLYASVRMSLK